MENYVNVWKCERSYHWSITRSSPIVAHVSLFSFLKATKCIAFHSSRLDVSTVSYVSQLQLLYESTHLRSARTRFRDWNISADHISDSRSYKKEEKEKEEKPTSLINENKWIDNPSNNNRRLRWRWLLRWKNGLNHKNNNGRNFQFKKFSFIDFVLTDRRSLLGKQLIGYINTREKIRYFFACVVTAFLRAGNPCITPHFM